MTQHRSDVPILRGEEHDIFSSLGKHHALTIAPRPSLRNNFVLKDNNILLTFFLSSSSRIAPRDHIIAKTMSFRRCLAFISLASSPIGMSPSSKSSAWETYMHSNIYKIILTAFNVYYTEELIFIIITFIYITI